MPVRIYDISKKLGLENKEVISKAKALGIAGARVASSSLDKITAEYLEQQLIQDHPNLAAAAIASPVAANVSEPIVLVKASPPPQEETIQQEESSTETATALLEPESPPTEAPAEPETAP